MNIFFLFNFFLILYSSFSFNQLFQPTAVLILDNATCHSNELKSNDGKIFTMFLPPNVTSLIQPMDQNIIRLTKLYYRTNLLSSVIASGDISKKLKSITIKEGILNLNQAWTRITSSIIQKCWKNILIAENDDESEDDIPLSVIKERLENEDVRRATLENVVLLNSYLEPSVQITLNDIEDWNNQEKNVATESENVEIESENGEIESENGICSESESEEKQKVTSTEAVQALRKVISWAEENIEDYTDLEILRKIQTKAVLKSVQTKRQTKLSDFFCSI